MSLNPSMFVSILPQLLVLLLALVILALDVILPREKQHNLGWVTAVGLGAIILATVTVAPGKTGVPVWGGMISRDWLGYVFTLLFMFGAAVTALLAMDYPGLGDRGEFYVLMLISTIGMTFMASATDLVMLYLAIETTSIPMYVLAGFFGGSDESTEAGFKYLLYGAMSSAVMLYGFSLIFGLAGTTSMYYIAAAMNDSGLPEVALLGAFLLVLVGIGFKVSVVPFHFWAPDVYQGAPTPVAGFLSTASKAAGFAALLRLLYIVFPVMAGQWVLILSALSVATMTLGNLIALTQRNIKRLLAYSSIAHAGYVLIGVVALQNPGSATSAQALGLTSVVYYLGAYLLTNLAAFGVVAAYSRSVGSDDLTAYYGMSRRSPGLALVMLVAFLSLAGMPPFAGFVAKIFLFAAAIEANLILLAVLGVLNSIIGLYYYLTVLKYIYLYRQDGDEIPLPALSKGFTTGLALLSVGILVVGVWFTPWYDLARAVASTFALR